MEELPFLPVGIRVQPEKRVGREGTAVPTAGRKGGREEGRDAEARAHEPTASSE